MWVAWILQVYVKQHTCNNSPCAHTWTYSISDRQLKLKLIIKVNITYCLHDFFWTFTMIFNLLFRVHLYDFKSIYIDIPKDNK